MFSGMNADECPAGSYCIEGIAEPIPCPEGTYSPTPGLHDVTQCLNSTGGYYCNQTGKTREIMAYRCKTTMVGSYWKRNEMESLMNT